MERSWQDILAEVRAYGEKIAHQQGKVLSRGQTGANRWRNEPHDLLHHPQDNPPQLLRESDLTHIGDGPGSANDVKVVSHSLMTHYLKRPYGNYPAEARKEAGNELGAYTVLGSLGFHVPHTSIVRDTKGNISSLSRKIGEGGMIAQHLYDLPAHLQDYWGYTGQYLPHPSDTMYQPLAPVIGLDNDRNDGNVMKDEHDRHWDFDFGTGDGAEWIQPGGLSPEGHQVLIHGLKTFLKNEAGQFPGAHDAAMKTIGKLAHPDAEDHFDWLAKADKAAYKAVGAPDPHTAVIKSLRTLRPDLERI